MTTTLIDTFGRPLTLRRGASPTHVFNVVEEGTSNPKNLTGASEITFAIAPSAKSNTRLLELTLDDGVTHTGDGGVVSVPFTAAQTEALPVGTLYCELAITDFDGRRDVVGAGDCIVHDSLVAVP